MTNDPTKAEMLDFLTGIYGEDSNDDAEVAIYWFANDWHSGQWSNLYSALSMSPFNPGPISTLESEGEHIRDMYSDLESQFTKQK